MGSAARASRVKRRQMATRVISQPHYKRSTFAQRRPGHLAEEVLRAQYGIKAHVFGRPARRAFRCLENTCVRSSNLQPERLENIASIKMKECLSQGTIQFIDIARMNAVAVMNDSEILEPLAAKGTADRSTSASQLS